MCSKGGPDMAAINSPGGSHVLPRTVWGDQLMYDRSPHRHRPWNRITKAKSYIGSISVIL